MGKEKRGRGKEGGEELGKVGTLTVFGRDRR